MGSFLNEPSSTPGVLLLPYTASLAYSCSSPNTNLQLLKLRPTPPAARKMSPIPTVKTQANKNRSSGRQSSIPQQTSILAYSPKKACLRTPPSSSSLASLQTSTPIIQPKFHAQAQRASLPSETRPPPSHGPSREFSPRSDSLLPYIQRSAKHDLSSACQQPHIRNYSTQALTGVEAAIASKRNTASISLSPPAQSRLPKPKTSTSLENSSFKLTPQRQLMKALDPPLPRRQTTGSLSCVAGDGTKETPPPVKSESNSINSNNEKEHSGMDVLLASRMADHKVEIYKQVTRETQVNKQRMPLVRSTEKLYTATHAQKCPASDYTEINPGSSQVDFIRSPRASKRFGMINMTKNEEMDLRLLCRDGYRGRDNQKLAIDCTTSGDLSVNTSLATNTPQTPVFLVRPDSEMIFAPASVDGSEIDVKSVYLGQEPTYWTGRFSTLCDRLKTRSAYLMSSEFDTALTLPSSQGMQDTEDSFEIAKWGRTEHALNELRSCCRTNAALRSFEEFETQLKEQLGKCAEGKRILAQGPFARSAKVDPVKTPKTEFKPKFGWQFGHGQTSDIDGRAIVTGGALIAKQRLMMIKSKTTSNLTSILAGDKDRPTASNFTASSMSDAKSLPGLNWQRPAIHEAQAQAKRIREQRVFAKAVAYRKANAQEDTSGRGRKYKFAAWGESAFGKTVDDGHGEGTNSEELMASGVTQDWNGNEPISTDMKPAARVGHSRKSSGPDSLSLKKVLADSMKGMRNIRRSFTGSGSVSGSERLID